VDNRLKRAFRAILVALVVPLMSTAAAGQPPEDATPFDAYARVADKIFVVDRSQFAPYKGPDVSRWKLAYPDEPDNPDYNRRRLGIISLAPGVHVYLDVMHDPEDEYYELRDVKTGDLVFEFGVHDGLEGALLFNGQGSMYKYARPGRLCTTIKETRKYSLNHGKLTEVKQPLMYWGTVAATMRADATLRLEPNVSSPEVAKLPAEEDIKVLAHCDGWLLIATPLGLTGWVPDRSTDLDLYGCG
jgi:hypothetical protein